MGEAALSSAVASSLDKASCAPDPHCNLEGDRCKCCFNGGCDYEDLCRCGFANNDAILNSTGSLDVGSQGVWCQHSGEACGWGSWPFWCCPGSRCQKEMGNENKWSCAEYHPAPTCKQAGERGGGFMGQTSECCGSAQCRQEVGVENKWMCVETPSCKAVGEVCGAEYPA